ncbi:MAG: hypothetical protein ACT4N3_04850 [Sphingosinicella sp.]
MRDGRDPELVSARLSESYEPLTADARGRAIRHDGFTPDRQRLFLDILAACGVVADAARAAGVCRDTVYAFRNRPEARAFLLAWDAALLLARARMSDELMSRALNGCIDRLYRDGELVAERHRHDNRLAMAVLSRLDRQAEGLGEGAAVARIIGQDWERFLGIVESGGGEAAQYLAERAPAAPKPEDRSQIESAGALIERLEIIALRDSGRAAEIRTDDLDPQAMDKWTDLQWMRADLSGFLDALPKDAWPDSAHDPLHDRNLYRTCRTRRVYLARHPDRAGPDIPLGDVWFDEVEESWRTDFPPPPDFDGAEEGCFGDDDYSRSLSEEEELAAEAMAEAEREDAADELTAYTAEAEAARDLYFGFLPRRPGDAPLADDTGRAKVPANAGEGETG